MLAANDQQPFITITKRRSSPKNKKPSEATTSLGQPLKKADFSLTHLQQASPTSCLVN
jgi:hypothetical protein